jgi:hypothetical protein
LLAEIELMEKLVPFWESFVVLLIKKRTCRGSTLLLTNARLLAIANGSIQYQFWHFKCQLGLPRISLKHSQDCEVQVVSLIGHFKTGASAPQLHGRIIRQMIIRGWTIKRIGSIA